jgi:broad specificity phosphatase PhoE
MAIKRILFIRPGETEWNRVGRQQGWAAIPLNAHGQEQAKRLANFVRHLGVGALYSSDLPRAKETTEIIASKLSIEPIYDSRLRERNVGQWQGLTLGEIREWCADEYEQFRERLNNFQIPGGEARFQVVDRLISVFDDIERHQKDVETVAIVTHSIAIRTLLSKLIPDYPSGGMQLSNISVTTIAHEDGEWKMIEANDVSHLDGMEAKTIAEPEA